jgi:3-hydroxyacyl-[acyl-carrier-protein] dehydratase
MPLVTGASIQQISSILLEMLPQQKPFRFLDGIDEIDEGHISGYYTYKQDEWFYRGHFPGNPITPGVVLVETMAQCGVVAFGIYLQMLEDEKMQQQTTHQYVTLFTDVTAEFLRPVLPGQRVLMKGEKMMFRRRKLTSKVSMFTPEGQIIATATLSGMGVKRDE